MRHSANGLRCRCVELRPNCVSEPNRYKPVKKPPPNRIHLDGIHAHTFKISSKSKPRLSSLRWRWWHSTIQMYLLPRQQHTALCIHKYPYYPANRHKTCDQTNWMRAKVNKTRDDNIKTNVTTNIHDSIATYFILLNTTIWKSKASEIQSGWVKRVFSCVVRMDSFWRHNGFHSSWLIKPSTN